MAHSQKRGYVVQDLPDCGTSCPAFHVLVHSMHCSVLRQQGQTLLRFQSRSRSGVCSADLANQVVHAQGNHLSEGMRSFTTGLVMVHKKEGVLTGACAARFAILVSVGKLCALLQGKAHMQNGSGPRVRTPCRAPTAVSWAPQGGSAGMVQVSGETLNSASPGWQQSGAHAHTPLA